MVVHLLFFDYNKKNVKAYSKYIKIDTPQFKSITVCEDVKKLVEEFSVTFIVSPANSLGFMNGGIDAIYMEMFPDIQKTVQNEIAKFNIVTSLGRKVLPIGSTLVVKTNDSKTPYLCCCPTMFMPGKLSQADNVYWAFVGLLQTMKHYTSVEKVVVACPCLGTGVGGLKAKNSAKEIQRAFDDFNNNRIKYVSQIVYDCPKGFVLGSLQTAQTQNSDNIEAKSIQAQKTILKLLTWNIWFKQFHFQERMDHIVEELKRHEPDVACFQEATKYSIEHFNNNNYISFKYDLMYDPTVISGYGDVILVKKTIKECFMSSEPYPETNMTRRMTRVYLPYFECELCTTHLESVFKVFKNKETKEPEEPEKIGEFGSDLSNIKYSQFKKLLSEMSESKAKNVILAGDFNFAKEDDIVVEQLLSNSPFEDVFETLPNDKKGLVVDTFDSTTNKNIFGNYQSRLDRMYIYSKDKTDRKLTPFNYKVIGMTPFIPREPSNQGYVFPSDHFGVLCTFTL